MTQKLLGLCCIRSRIMYGIMFMITLPRHCKNYASSLLRLGRNRLLAPSVALTPRPHISVYKKALPITDRKGELALYHLRLHRSIYMHINSNASCPVTWTNRKNLCRLRLSGFFGSKATFHDFCLKHLSACPECITISRTGCSL